MIGSSPRTRGTHPAVRDPHAARRFIPAYTGNSTGPQPGEVGPAVHPRVHGELLLFWIVQTCGYGSSPRTRGTRN